jgi:hypothetical protein
MGRAEKPDIQATDATFKEMEKRGTHGKELCAICTKEEDTDIASSSPISLDPTRRKQITVSYVLNS